ncbi:43kDa postsynaptic protein [Trema orientale]|uniref:43kDa postsynaptic protein n=1 Tax=Trema orientale TaxID=63057 RepID=A0A2P5F0B9_TREOI|nr:43kDa postsynaptic protein [Trema orientale]
MSSTSGDDSHSNSGDAEQPNQLSCDILPSETSCPHCINNHGSSSSASSSTGIVQPRSPGIFSSLLLENYYQALYLDLLYGQDLQTPRETKAGIQLRRRRRRRFRTRPKLIFLSNQVSLQEQEPEEVQESSSSTATSTAIIDPLSPGIVNAAFRHFRSTHPGPDRFNQYIFLQRYLRRLYGNGLRIMEVHVVIEDDGQGFESTLGQACQQELAELVQRISEEEEEEDGDDMPRPRPASKSAVEELRAIKASEELSNSESNKCSVGIGNFKKGAELRELPCKHMHHKDCILRWLKIRNTCPECQHELPREYVNEESRMRWYSVQSVGFCVWFYIRLPDEDDHHDLAQENENQNGSEGTEGTEGS